VAFRKQDMETSSQGFKWIPEAPCGMASYNSKVKLKICWHCQKIDPIALQLLEILKKEW